MVYVLYGTIDYLIKNEINSIFKDNNINNIDISKYNMNEDLLGKIINDANSISLFDEKKGIIVSNSYVFTGTINKKIDQDLTILEDYLNNINDQAILIFIVNNEKLDERKKIVKLAKTKATIKEYNNTDINKTIKDYLEDYKMSNDTLKLLIDRVGNNITLLINEIEKIKIYKGDNKTITNEDIINLTSKTLEENNFKLIDSIIRKNKSEAIQLYNERLKLNEEPIAIIITLANQIRIMYQVKGLYMQGHTEKEIASILGIHPYRVKLGIQNAKKYNSNDLLNFLNKLADLDYNIKTGNADKVLGLELFILSM